MSEEEKKAIFELKHYSNIGAFWKETEYRNSEIDNYIKIILNLIEKQSKEIEELKKENDLYKKIKQLFENDLLGYIKGYEDGRNGSTGLAYKVGKEFADYTLSLQLNRYKESYIGVRKELDNAISKDKIKAKIEEVDNKGMTVNLVNRSAGKTFQQVVNYEVKKVLQELLEE